MSTLQAEQIDLEPAELIRRFQTGIWRYLRYLGADPMEADDLVQETFLAVLRGKFEHRDDRQTSAYLRKVARNQLLQVRRRQGNELCTVELVAAESVWASAAPDDGLENYLSALRDCLQNVTDRARQAIELVYRDRCQRIEAADQLNMKPEGIKTLLRRTRATLRACVERKVKS